MSLRVVGVGPLATFQDRGRPGWAHLGVPRSGALDQLAADLANRLVGNQSDCAVVEILLGGLSVSTDRGVWVSVTGAPCQVEIEGRANGFGSACWLAPGARLDLGRPSVGVRSYLAVAGGFAVEPVLGSRSTDTFGGVGPAALAEGDVLPVGTATGEPAALDTPRPPETGPLRLTPGPRAGWVDGDVIDLLCRASYTVSPHSDRVGLRLSGQLLPRARSDELASEGIVLGSVQLPPDGLPVVFLADHPTTGGYPVVAVVEPADLWQCAQLRPGDPVRFAEAPRG